MFLDRVRYRTPYAVRNSANNNLVYILIKVNNLAAETSFSFGDQFNATTMGKAMGPDVGSSQNGLVMTLLGAASVGQTSNTCGVDENELFAAAKQWV